MNTSFSSQITNTPIINKQKNFYESSIETESTIFSLATCENSNTPPSTPRKRTSSAHKNDITPPMKKTKRRDCTPVSPSKYENSISSSYFLLSQHKSKSKFLEKIENCSNTIINDFDSKLRGAILLSQIDNYSLQINIMKVIIEDNELFVSLTEQIISSFVEGFNTKSQVFFTFLISQTVLEIVNIQIGSFNNSLKILNDNIKLFEIDDKSKEVDIDWNNNFFFLSVSGFAVLNGEGNVDKVRFVLSFKVNINQNRSAYFNSDISSSAFKINQVICVDHIKIKIN